MAILSPHPTSNFHQKIIILLYSTYQNKSTELLRMSIILKKRKKFFLISENKVICKGPPPASFTCRGSWVQSLLWGAEGGAVSWQPACSCQGEEMVSRAVIWRGAA